MIQETKGSDTFTFESEISTPPNLWLGTVWMCQQRVVHRHPHPDHLALTSIMGNLTVCSREQEQWFPAVTAGLMRCTLILSVLSCICYLDFSLATLTSCEI